MACINVVSNALMNDFLIPTLFFLIGFITSFFNKNMIIILSIAMCVSNIIKYGTKVRVHEGFDKKSESTTENTATTKDEPSSKPTKPLTNVVQNRKTENESIPVGDPKPSTERSKMDPAKLKETKLQLKELKSLHDSITNNMTTIEESLKNAEVIFDKVKEGFSFSK